MDTSPQYRPDSKNIPWCENNIQRQKEEEIENWKKCQLMILFKLYHNEQEGKIGG